MNITQSQKNNTYIIFTPERKKRPDQNTQEVKPLCPFCLGSEHMTPPEVARIGEGLPDTPGWKVRVVPNKYPITDIHEVIIHSPFHDQDIPDLPSGQIKDILTMYKQRLSHYEQQGHAVVFCNSGKLGGASLPHPHSQLSLLPSTIPLPEQEPEKELYPVFQTDLVRVFCPSFSQWPLEVWIESLVEESFTQITDNSLSDLSTVLPTLLNRIKKAANSDEVGWKEEKVPYNYYIINSKPWRIRILPRLQLQAGFEFATGISVNTVSPQTAALLLQKEK